MVHKPFPVPHPQERDNRQRYVDDINKFMVITQHCRYDIEQYEEGRAIRREYTNDVPDESVICINKESVELSNIDNFSFPESMLDQLISKPISDIMNGDCAIRSRRQVECSLSQYKQFTVHIFMYDDEHVLLLKRTHDSGIYRAGTLTMVQGHVGTDDYMLFEEKAGKTLYDVAVYSAMREFSEEVIHDFRKPDLEKMVRSAKTIALINTNITTEHYGLTFLVKLDCDELSRHVRTTGEPNKHSVELIERVTLYKHVYDFDPLVLEVLKFEPVASELCGDMLDYVSGQVQRNVKKTDVLHVLDNVKKMIVEDDDLNDKYIASKYEELALAIKDKMDLC